MGMTRTEVLTKTPGRDQPGGSGVTARWPERGSGEGGGFVVLRAQETRVPLWEWVAGGE